MEFYMYLSFGIIFCVVIMLVIYDKLGEDKKKLKMKLQTLNSFLIVILLISLGIQVNKENNETLKERAKEEAALTQNIADELRAEPEDLIMTKEEYKDGYQLYNIYYDDESYIFKVKVENNEIVKYSKM